MSGAMRPLRPVVHRGRPAASAGSGGVPSRAPMGPLLPLIVAVGLACFMVAAFVVLDYRFDQEAHRLVKIMFGASALGAMLIWPFTGLVVLAVVTPFLMWLPKMPGPGLNTLNVLIVTCFLSWALRRVLDRKPLFQGGALGGLLAALVGLGALSVVRGAAFPTGYRYEAGSATLELFRSAMTFAAYFITLSMAHGRRDRRWLAWAIVAGLALESLATIHFGRNGRGGRAVGSFGQSNELGAFLVMFTVFAAALIPGVRGWFGRIALAFAVLAGTWATILSLSRGAFVALFVGLVFVGFRTSKLLLVGLMLVVASSPLWAPDFLRQRIAESSVEVEGSDQRAMDQAVQVRVTTWRAIARVVSEHPLDGVGFSGLAEVLPSAGEALGVDVVETAHNTYLRFLGEMGLLGLLLFVGLLVACFVHAWKGASSATDPFDRRLCDGVAAATLAMAVSCVFGDRFFSILIAGNFWMACALVDDVRRERRAAVS